MPGAAGAPGIISGQTGPPTLTGITGINSVSSLTQLFPFLLNFLQSLNSTLSLLGITLPISPPDYCFNSSIVFDGYINDQLVIAPMSPQRMNVSFLLFTCANRNAPQNFTYLSPSSAWRNSNFIASVKTRMDAYNPGLWMKVSLNDKLKTIIDNA